MRKDYNGAIIGPRRVPLEHRLPIDMVGPEPREPADGPGMELQRALVGVEPTVRSTSWPGDRWSATSWYTLRTRSRHEKAVRDQIAGLSIEAFLPIYERWSQWKDRRQKIAFPLFPGYCFARFSLAERLRVLNVAGVADILSLGGRPEPVPDAEIDAIQRLVSTRLHYDPHPFFTEGTEVEVIRGPLAGVRGKLLRKDRATRLVLAVTLIRQATVVEIHASDVMPV